MLGPDGEDALVPCKIAILLPDLRPGGVERVRLILAKRWAEAGHQVEIVLQRATGALLEDIPRNVAVVDLGAPRIRALLPALLRYLSNSKPDALLAAMWPLTAVASIARMFARAPFQLVLSEHTDLREAPWLTRWERALLRHGGCFLYGRADAIVAVSKGVATSLAEVANVPPRNISIINNPVRTFDVGKIAGGQKQLLMWWLDAPHRLISIGSLKQPKAFDQLITAVALTRRRLDARLVILGEGPLRSSLQQQINSLGLADVVRLPGYVQDPFPIIARASLYVSSSVREGFPNVLTEALTCGVPVVATDCRSGPSEILEDGKFGTLVPVNNVPALAEAIEDALTSVHDGERLRARAREFSPEKAASAYLDLLGC